MDIERGFRHYTLFMLFTSCTDMIWEMVGMGFESGEEAGIISP